MRSIEPGNISLADLQQILVGTVAPRPIALVSTINENGITNLAPYSFFNVFSSNPPVLIFSSNRRGNDNTTKDTLHNVGQNSEVVVHVVTEDIVRQATLASINYPSDISEFEKAGFTAVESVFVKPFRVEESPVHFECKVRLIYHLGAGPGAGNLIICDILTIHVDEKIFNNKGQIDPERIRLVGRLGRAFYTETSGDSIFRIVQPVGSIGIGFDKLPESIRMSPVLTGNDLADLASIERIPQLLKPNEQVLKIMSNTDTSLQNKTKWIHQLAKEMLNKGELNRAWEILLTDTNI